LDNKNNLFISLQKDKNKGLKIKKIYRSLDNYHNQLNANKEKFEKIYDNVTSDLANQRNLIFSIFVAVATVLLGVAQLAPLQLGPLMVIQLYWLIGIGLAGVGFPIYIYIFSRKKKGKNENFLRL
jgi:hypothetical protein